MRIPRPKRLRRCLNPHCPHADYVVGNVKGATLSNTRVGEYAKLQCPKCGDFSIFNPVGKPAQHPTRCQHIVYDSRRKAYSIEPKARVLRV